MPKRRSDQPVDRPNLDWIAIRRAREIQGSRWAELQREFGISRQRIQRRARKEGWREPGEIVQKATEDFARKFVAREAEAVLTAYRDTLDAVRRLQALIARRIGVLEESPAEADPSTLRHLAETVRKCHSVIQDAGGLGRNDDWRRTGSVGGFEDDDSDAVQAALEELDRCEG